MSSATFGLWDYIIFAIMLAISAGIGVYFRFTGGKQKTAQEYLMADKNMSIIPVGFSLMASFMSAITLLGVSMENYAFGTQFVIINLSYGIGTPIAAYGYLPVFHRLQCTSAYEYLERRFGFKTRLAASFAFSLQMILYMGIVLYAPALALSQVTGISKIGAILSVGLVCTFYSTIGGMKAVLVTDVFQSLIMFAAIFSVIIKGTIDAGGVEKVWTIADEGGRIEFFDFRLDPRIRHTFWSLTIGGAFTYLSLYAVNQAQVQRLLTIKNLKKSQQAIWLNWPILTTLSLSTSFSGIVIYSRYFNCDPWSNKQIASLDQILPYFVMDTMSHITGLAGLFVAGIFSGSLSTVSSAVNSLAAVTIEDYLKQFYEYKGFRQMTDKKQAILSKLLALFYGALCLVMAFAAEYLGGVLQSALTIFGVVGGPLFGLFTLGMFFWISNETGALVGIATGLAISLWIGFGGPKPPPPYLPFRTDGCNNTSSHVFNRTASQHYHTKTDDTDYMFIFELSYLWYGVIGFSITLITGLIVSVIKDKFKPGVQKPLNPDLFSPFVKWLIPKDSTRFTQEESVSLPNEATTSGNSGNSANDTNDTEVAADSDPDATITSL